MNSSKWMTAIFICLLSIATLANSAEQRVETGGVVGFAFNEINSSYMPRPTFADIKSFDHGSKQILRYKSDGYGHGGSELEIAQEYIDVNIEVLQKFIQWAQMASDRGDMLDKEIAIVPAYEVKPFTMWNKYDFHSGNKNQHFLIVYSGGTKIFGFSKKYDDQKGFTLDKENVIKLIKRLEEFKGKIQTTIESDYK